MNIWPALLVLVSLSCTQSIPDDRRSVSTQTTSAAGSDAKNAEGPTLELTWNPVEGAVDAYHIFFVEESVNQGGVEITSLMPSSNDFKQPRVKVDSKLVQLKGRKSACFYVIADASGTMSEPSDPVCIAL